MPSHYVINYFPSVNGINSGYKKMKAHEKKLEEQRELKERETAKAKEIQIREQEIQTLKELSKKYQGVL